MLLSDILSEPDNQFPMLKLCVMFVANKGKSEKDRAHVPANKKQHGKYVLCMTLVLKVLWLEDYLV